MNFIRTLCLILLSGLSGAVLAGPTSSTTSPVIFISQSVLGGVSTFKSSTSGVSAGSNGFGQSTPPTLLPTGQSASLASSISMPALDVNTGCPGPQLQSTCVLLRAASWISANAIPLANTIGAWEANYGYTSAWFTYSQSIQLFGESKARTLTWSMFVNGQSQGTYGAPQLSAGSGAPVLYVSYATLAAPAGIPDSWVKAINPQAGQVVWQLLDANLQPQTLPVAIQVNGAFDQEIPAATTAGSNVTVTHGNGYQLLLGNGLATTAPNYGATIAGLLAQTGASLAMVDYAYPLEPVYATTSASDLPCPGVAGPCQRAVATYTFTALTLTTCDCTNVQFTETGTYQLELSLLADRTIATLSVDPSTGTVSISSQLLKEYTAQSLSPSTPFNPMGLSNSPVGSWTMTIPGAVAASLAATPQVLQPLDGKTLVPPAALIVANTPGSAVKPSPLLPIVPATSNSDNVYWETIPVSGTPSTYLGLEIRCDVNNNALSFLAGYNVGGVEATDNSPNGGFVNPVWATPLSTAPSPFSSGAGASTCLGYSYPAAGNSAIIEYYYQLNNGCAPLVATEGAGSVCPNNYSLIHVTDAGVDTGVGSCLQCGIPGSSATAAIQQDGTTEYTCTDPTGGSSAAAQSSPLYAITLGCSASAAAANAAYGWAVGDWQIPQNMACGIGYTETRSVYCEDQTGSTVLPSYCSGSAPAASQPLPTIACPVITYAWFASGFTAPPNTCGSVTETQVVTCQDNHNNVVDPSNCNDAGTAPPTSQTVNVYTGCPYIWSSPPWGECTVSGTTFYKKGLWMPETGCGPTDQTRTIACKGTATETRKVQCLSQINGSVQPDANCASLGQAPADTQACTPPGGFICSKPAPANTRSAFGLTNGCTYGWQTSGWSSCTGAAAALKYTAWTPAAPATGCTTINQTRTDSCVVTAGTQTQTVACMRGDGTPASDNGQCTGAAPPTTQACTPTPAPTCGTEDPLSQSTAITNGCVYAWTQSAWTSCTGGSGNWNYSGWTGATSACGGGTGTLSKTGTCVVTANSGSQSSTNTCTETTTKTTVVNSLCTGAAPVTSQVCTPPSGFSCGIEDALTKSIMLTDSCTYGWQAGSWSSCLKN